MRYDALTGIRFLAAFAVFVAHFGNFDFGAQGVSLFFVLSGFILTKVYTEREWTPGQFYWARFARIYPAYFFALVVSFPIFYGLIKSHESPVLMAVSVLALVHAWEPSTAHFWNNPSWSLSAEALFYFIFPFVLPLFRARVRLLALAVVVLWIGQVWQQMTGDYSDGGQFITKFPLFRVPEFLIGIAFGMMHGRVHIPYALPVSAALVVLAALFMPTFGTHTALAPVYGLMMLGLTTHHGFLSSKPMVLLGEASYSFYLLHIPVILSMLWIERYLVGTVPVLIKAPLLLGVTLALSLLSLIYIERPARARMLRWWEERRAGRMAHAPP